MVNRKTGTIESLERKTAKVPTDKNKNWYAWLCKCNGFSVSVPSGVWEKLPVELKVGDTCTFEVEENEQGYLSVMSVTVVGNYAPELADARQAKIEKYVHEKQERIDEAILQKKALKVAELCVLSGKTVEEVVAVYSEAKKKLEEKVE